MGYTLDESKGAAKLEFYVKDSGIGIPKNRQEAVFNRFVQADVEDRSVYQGSGLGLAISKAFVEMLEGKIWVESEYGSGSAFYFTLPYNPTEKSIAKKPDSTSDSKEAGKGQLKILIVEDEEISIEYLQVVLEDYGKEIIVTKRGAEAVELCKNHPDIELILMDIKLPGINGYEATRKIREFNNNVIIVAQTAYAQIGDKEKCLEAGCNDFITKPINEEELIKIINKYRFIP